MDSSTPLTPRVIVPLWAAALTALLLWPQRLPGYGLGRDMVFTPQQPWGADTLGVGSTPPRAVPVDALVAALERVVDGAVVGRVALVVPLLVAGLGAAHLLRGASLPARLGACGFAIWNPWVVERLALGQWSLVWGYAGLAGVAAAVISVRRQRRSPFSVVPSVAFASITPTGGLLACLVAIMVAAWPGRDGDRRPAGRMLTIAAALQAPWLLAVLLGHGGTTSDAASVAAFATRGEFGGALTTALSGGGVWNAAVVPSSREGVAGLLVLVVIFAAAFVSWRWFRVEPTRSLLTPLLSCALIGLVLAVGASVPAASAVVRWVVTEVPGGGLLRDGQKWLAPLVLLESVLIGAAVDVAVTSVRARAVAARVLLGVVAAALPLLLVPDATTVVWPTVTPVRYPAGYRHVATIVGQHPGAVVVVPFQPYRAFSWADGRPSLDPAPRLLPGSVVVDDRLQVDGRLLAGQDPHAAAVAAVLASNDPSGGLASEGVRWVLVERRTPGAVVGTAGLDLVFNDDSVALFEVPGPATGKPTESWRITLASTVLALWAAGVALVVAWPAVSRVRRRMRRTRLGSS